MKAKNPPSKDAREVALQALYLTEKGGWSQGVLKKLLQPLDARDSALATRLTFGVLQQRGLLDFYLGHFSKMPLKKMEQQVLQILRLGAYQILFLDKIPHSAAVDSAVNLCKKHSKHQRAPGMVNGILRSLSRQHDNLPPLPENSPLETLSIQYSHPLPLVELLARDLPSQDLPQFLEANNQHPPLTAMINTCHFTAQQVEEQWNQEGVSLQKHPWLPDCFVLEHPGNIEKLPSFIQGMFYIQDPASRLTALCCDPQPGQKVLDCCAAPGGKSLALALAMGDQGSITACDLHPHKKALISASATRLNLSSITPETANATQFHPPWQEQFDLVLVDAPCSGLGVIGKKPDIRYKELEPLEKLPEIQGQILENTANYLNPGGVLVYSTCTILSRENLDVIQTFLNQHKNFQLEAFELPEIGPVQDGHLTLYPHQHQTDGFFMARLRKAPSPTL